MFMSSGSNLELEGAIGLNFIQTSGVEINTHPRLVVLAAGLLAAGVWIVRWASEKIMKSKICKKLSV